MKRMMLIFFSGCALIGIGAGITFLELRSWKISDYRSDLIEKPLETYEKTVCFEKDKETIDVEVNYYYQEINNPPIDVVSDEKYTDSLLISVDYRGSRPQIYQSGWWEEDDRIHTSFLVDTNSYTSMEDAFSLLESMFDNKTLYRYGENSRIEKITVYTAYPDKIIN